MSTTPFRNRRLVMVGVSVALGGGTILASTVGASAHDSSSGSLRVTSVKVVTPNTVDTTFSNPLDPAKLTTSVFHAPHWDWDVPHSHNATSMSLSNGNRTVRVVLDRNLHSENPPCDGSEPRCSDDELDWVISGATDIYGQKIYNDDWEVWAVGSDN